MQIEIIGSTGAGKSTLTKSILHANSNQDLDILTSFTFVLRKSRTDWIKNHSIRMVLLNLFALLACLLSFRKNFELFRFVKKTINQFPASVSWIEKLKIARIVARNIGIYEIVDYYSTEKQVVLADEGTIHIAHYLFVHVSVEPNVQDVKKFIDLVPIPDAVVYLKQPGTVLTSRTTTRGHKRISGNGSNNVSKFINHAEKTFEIIEESSIIKDQLLTVDGEKWEITPICSGNNPILSNALNIVRAGINFRIVEQG